MRLLVVLITVMINCANIYPISCKCSVGFGNHQNDNSISTTISCQNFNKNETLETKISTLFDSANLSNIKISNCANLNLTNVSFIKKNIRALDLSENKVKYLSNTKSVFNVTNLKALDLSNNEIRMIEKSPFITLTSLEVLNLSANVIDTLTENAFNGLSKLQCLDISSNKLTTINSDVFIPLSTLQCLNLSNNLLQILDEACLSSLQRLQQLDVSWNRLAHVAPGSLQLPSLSRLLLAGNPALGGSREPPLLVGPGKRLQTVDASRTGLKQVPAALTHSIRTLRLAGNSIKTVSCGHLDSYPLLQLLDFTSNDLEDIDDDALGRLEVLSILYLSDNKLRAIPHDLPERLKILHLERNKIEQILSGDLQGMPLLEVLLLSDNKVKVVQEGAFSQLGALATLDLSQNPISVLPAGILSGPWQLQVLRLSNLNVISPALEMSFPLSSTEHLVTLDLSNSPSLSRQFLSDTAALAASKELQELNLSGNGIEEIRSDLLHYLPQLRILLLQNNSLNCTDLHWLAKWMRRQDQPESRKLTCYAPSDISGSLLVDLEDVELVTQLNYELSTLDLKQLIKSTPIVNRNNSYENSTISKFNLKSDTVTRKSSNETTLQNITLSTTKSSSTTDDVELSNKQNFSTTTVPTTYNSRSTTIATIATTATTTKQQEKELLIKNGTLATKEISNKTENLTSTMKYKKTSRLQNVNELNTLISDKRQENVRSEISQNLFITKKKSSLNNELSSKENKNNLQKSFHSDKEENVTERPGEMSMFTEQNHQKDIIQVGMLVLFAGILGAVTTLALIMCRFRKRRRSLQEQDIEVSSLPSVTELW